LAKLLPKIGGKTQISKFILQTRFKLSLSYLPVERRSAVGRDWVPELILLGRRQI
jgi:hypothetical protein